MSRTRKQSPRRIANSCRNHGSCSWCVGNRLHAAIVRARAADESVDAFWRGVEAVADEVRSWPAERREAAMLAVKGTQ